MLPFVPVPVRPRRAVRVVRIRPRRRWALRCVVRRCPRGRYWSSVSFSWARSSCSSPSSVGDRARSLRASASSSACSCRGRRRSGAGTCCRLWLPSSRLTSCSAAALPCARRPGGRGAHVPYPPDPRHRRGRGVEGSVDADPARGLVRGAGDGAVDGVPRVLGRCGRRDGALRAPDVGLGGPHPVRRHRDRAG